MIRRYSCDVAELSEQSVAVTDTFLSPEVICLEAYSFVPSSVILSTDNFFIKTQDRLYQYSPIIKCFLFRLSLDLRIEIAGL